MISLTFLKMGKHRDFHSQFGPVTTEKWRYQRNVALYVWYISNEIEKTFIIT